MEAISLLPVRRTSSGWRAPNQQSVSEDDNDDEEEEDEEDFLRDLYLRLSFRLNEPNLNFGSEST